MSQGSNCSRATGDVHIYQIVRTSIAFLRSAGTDIPWNEIIARPPVSSTEWEAEADGMRLSLEHWTWAGHSVLELSTKASSITEIADTWRSSSTGRSSTICRSSGVCRKSRRCCVQNNSSPASAQL